MKNLKDQRDRDDFEREQSIMSQMNHPNIVKLYGIVHDQGLLLTSYNNKHNSGLIINIVAPSIVLEYLPYGDLKNFLKVIIVIRSMIPHQPIGRLIATGISLNKPTLPSKNLECILRITWTS